MTMEAKEIECMILKALPDAQITITNMTGDGNHYMIHVISKKFIGKSRVKQHQLIYKALKGNVGNILHALSLQTEAPKKI